MKKVLLLCPYSYPSACGIWSRVYADALALKAEGYDVSIFSSNIIKGTDKTSGDYEELEGLKIYRFPVLFSLGGTSMFWNFLSKISEINPDIIHTHGYRHPHSLFSQLWGKLNKKITFLTTHAPFEKDKRRSAILKVVDIVYDIFIGWWELRLYKKVTRISNWETPYLEQLGAKDSVLITNGLKQIFLTNSPQITNEKFNQVIYMGRIDPVKQLEWLKKSAEILKDLKFKIIGPLSGYDSFKSESENLEVIEKTYTPEELIAELKTSDIYVLPSAREAMPFTLLEAMSQGKFVIGSPTNGSKEVIREGENGFIVQNESELIHKIKNIYDNWDELQSIRYNSVQTAQKFSANESNKKLLELYSSYN